MSFSVFPEMVPYGEATVRPRAASMVPYGEATRPRAASLQVQGPSTPSTYGLQHPLEASEAAWRREDEVQKRGLPLCRPPDPT